MNEPSEGGCDEHVDTLRIPARQYRYNFYMNSSMTADPLPRFGIFQTVSRVFESQSVGQAYDIGIWLPFSYSNSDRRYPALYVLDGEFLFPMVAGLSPTFIGSGEAPEMIIVGIAYHGISGWPEFGDLRERDHLPQEIQEPNRITRQGKYIDFLQHELIPFIEREYRASAEERALFGFSSSGFFSLYMMLNHPGLFRRHLATSCTWPGADTYFLNCIERYARLPQRPPVDLYLSTGEQETEFLPGFHKIVEALAAIPEVRLTHQIHEGEGHSAGNMAKTFLYGTKAVFQKE